MFHSSSPKVHYNIIVSAHNLEKIMFGEFPNALGIIPIMKFVNNVSSKGIINIIQ